MHSARLVTAAIVQTLAAADLHVGDGEAPTIGGWSGPAGASTFVPYTVVHPLPGGVLDGSLESPQADAGPLYQLSSYGASREQCEWMADAARIALLTGTLTVSGRTVTQIQVDMLGGARRDDQIQPPLWHCAERFQIDTTPQGAP